MRTVFFGTPELAVPTLAAVAERHEVTAVVCQPDKPQGRGKKVVPPPTKAWALEHGIPVHQPVKLNDGTFEAWLREQAPDICVLAAYGRILKQPILDVPRFGFVNMHPSLLPRHRGPSPVRGALLEGDSVTGVTIMRLDAGTDTGDIVLQEEVPIEPDDNAIRLTDRLAAFGGQLMVKALAQIASGEALYAPQDESRATHTRMLNKADGRICWDRPAHEIHNLVRAAVPWPAAQTRLENEVVQIHRTQVVDDNDAPASPGTIVRVERDRVVVATGQGALAVLEIQSPGKRVMPMGDYLRGHALHVGERFEEISNDAG
ncbi:MAG: methionyl-tRNA formyltransferase [FCB group bacterium]|nr:methionyl-tRNA formyltransferase [FCB group bacterium]